MLEDLGVSIDTMGIMGQVTTAFYYIIIFIIIAGILVWVLWYKKFTIKLIIKELTGDGRRKRVFSYRAREKTVDGVKYLQLLWRWDLLPLPPDKAVDITDKGKLFIQGYRTQSGEYIFAEDDGEKAINEKGKNCFSPLTTNQRLSLINQIKKANAKKKTNWTEHIPAIAGMMGLVMLVAIAFLFWDNVVAASERAGDVWGSNLDKQAEIMEIWREIKFNEQRIRKDETKGEQLPEIPPN